MAQGSQNTQIYLVFKDQWVDEETLTVTFKDFDDTILSTQQVLFGESAAAPPNPTREGFLFVG